MQNVSQNIKLGRKAKGWTQQQLADELFVTRQTVSNWERGKAMPDLHLLEKVAEKLDIDVTTLLYGERPVKGHTSRKIFNIAKYWLIAMLLFVMLETASLYFLDRISDYAGYTVVVEYGIWSHAVFFYSFIPFFVWVIIYRISSLAENYGNKIGRIIVLFALTFSVITVVPTAFSAIRHTLYTYERYEHIVKLGNERYEITDVDYITGVYKYHDMGWCGGSKNKIIYIDSTEETETDIYINDIVSRQPLKIERISEEKAVHFMHEYHIKNAPAVAIVRNENAEILEGAEEISLLEWKIHNFKQHNIFFY